ncbi:MAG: fasciclin [Flavobacterium sp.]|uniref:fasciclin domain-containing protein n=1 Tax=Flavobacterium sp. TaxID=239 RepID=UPI000CAAD467|nr:fasciclin domain-containing protein [Flavobacterium sp.]MBA4134222.1 fasciclin [Flavobacterium sp.]PJE40732.1 MAG: fasciclin [Flavobacterium sp.] [Flavobacterium sp. FEMGT703F]
MKNLIKKMSLACIALTMLSCSDDDNNTPQQQTIAAIAAGNSDFSTLVTALNRTGLTATLDGNGQFTVFAPTNAAFQTFFSSLGSNVTVNNVDVNVLKNILLNHVVATEIKSTDIPAATYVSTLSPISTAANAPTISMFVQKSGATVTINGGVDSKGAVVSTADVDASNGVIHIVNRVIQIPTLVDHVVDNPEFDTLQTVVTSTGGAFGDQSAVLSALSGLTAASPATLFAPNNAAFTSLISELTTAGISPTGPQFSSVLQYHVVGGNVRSTALPSVVSGSSAGVVPTLNGQNITISLTGGAKITGTFSPARPASNIIATDIQGSNGVIHVLDKVLLPTL